MACRSGMFEYHVGSALPFGVTQVPDGVQFAVYLPGKKDCYLNLYKKGKKNIACRIALTEQFKVGGGYFVVIKKAAALNDPRSVAQILTQDFEYLYEADGREFVDLYADCVSGREHWGKRFLQKQPLRGGICLQEFDWANDAPLRIPYSDLILYQLHVRGYTKHSSSKVTHKGTFAGLTEKIPYIKDLGVNGVLLLPIYEFCETQSDYVSPAGKGGKQETAGEQKNGDTGMPVAEILPENRINYWGYGTADTYYFAPKASYGSAGADVSVELKKMVRAFHENGMEVLLDMYFAPGTNLFLMTDCLRSWVLKYHIDGFRVNQEVLPQLTVVSDPILSGVKLLGAYWDIALLHSAGITNQKEAIGEYNEGYMNDARRFLKGDEGMVGRMVADFIRNDAEKSVVNFITHVNGFTLMDLVSYDVKHNQDNGELNRDGTEFNYSWNCGVEGKTRKKSILDRRMVQIRNAFAMLLTAQGTPMILAGDEFGHTQLGNNNAYCQDNAITWLNWTKTKTADTIRDFVKNMILLRKKFPVLHRSDPLSLVDTLSCGMPDLSIHGTQAWRPDYSNYSRMLGLLYYGEYVEEGTGRSVYIIYNMYWEAKSFDLPNLPCGRTWRVMADTYDNTFDRELLKLKPKVRKNTGRRVKKQEELQKKTVVAPRSVVIFVEI